VQDFPMTVSLAKLYKYVHVVKFLTMKDIVPP
jgi:hypothetical protein